MHPRIKVATLDKEFEHKIHHVGEVRDLPK